mgnify:CR=1 FL=1
MFGIGLAVKDYRITNVSCHNELVSLVKNLWICNEGFI